jgi:hypothetical protein
VSASTFTNTTNSTDPEPGAVTLPLNLISFDSVKKGNNKVLLQWSTASEQNTQSFIVEKNTNGNGYIQIGEVPAAGTSSTIENYSFTDNNPASGTNYCRLKMLDKDGKADYSEIRVLNFGDAKTILVFPNPAQII